MSVNFPYRDHTSTQLNKHQAAHTSVLIEVSGEVKVWSRFTNAKQLDGDHFVTAVTIFDAEGELIAVAKQVKGVDARGLGRTVEVDDFTSGIVPFWRAGTINNVQIEHTQWDSFDDKKFWETIKKIGENLLEEWIKQKSSGFRNIKESGASLSEVDRTFSIDQDNQ